MKRYGRLDENLQGTLQKNRVFCAVMPIHDQRISRRTETRRLFELTKLKKAPSFVIVGLFSADHYLVPCLSLLSSECVVYGTTRLKLTQENMNRILVPVPSIEEQCKIAQAINNLFVLIESIKASLS